MIIPIIVPSHTRFVATVRKSFFYRYTCEHCGKDQQWYEEFVVGSSRTTRLGTNCTITDEAQSALNLSAMNNLNKRYESAKSYAKARNYKKLRKYVFSKLYGECPFCRKTQSWAKRFDFLKFISIVLCVVATYAILIIIDDLVKIPFPNNTFIATIFYLWLSFAPLITGIYAGTGVADFLHKRIAKKYYIGGVLGRPKVTVRKN
jgi:hypothetical protein